MRGILVKWAGVVLATALVALCLLGPIVSRRTGQDSGPSIEQIRALASLVTARVSVTDVVQSRVRGYTGGITVVLVARGEILLGTDLARARLVHVDAEHRHAVLVLSQPQVLSAHLDQEQTRVAVASETGLWWLAPGGGSATAMVEQQGYEEAEQRLARVGVTPEMLQRAQGQAEEVLKAFFDGIGWHVRIEWA